jgi:hypothetical protein
VKHTAETSVMNVHINNTIHDADNNRHPYKKEVSNTNIMNSKISRILRPSHNLPVTIYFTISQVTTPHYGHPLTINRHTEKTTWLNQSTHKVLQGAPQQRTTSDINNSIPKFWFQATHYRKTKSRPPSKSTRYRLYGISIKFKINLMMANIKGRNM